jgi:hypothetical protein
MSRQAGEECAWGPLDLPPLLVCEVTTALFGAPREQGLDTAVPAFSFRPPDTHPCPFRPLYLTLNVAGPAKYKGRPNSHFNSPLKC